MSECCDISCDVNEIYNCNKYLNLFQTYVDHASVGSHCTETFAQKLEIWGMGYWLLQDSSASSSSNLTHAFPEEVCTVSCDLIKALHNKLGNNDC